MARIPTWLAALAALGGGACGRIGFAQRSRAGKGDAAPDGATSHVLVAPGWSVRVLADLTGVVPYVPDDFDDGGQVILDNAPETVAALYAPFTSILAVCAGRSIIELAANGTTAVHDYRPAMPDTTGPDDCGHLVFGAPADTGPALWIGAGTQGGGDGVYDVDPQWTLTRDSTNNNVNGIGYDATGAYDGLGAPAIYFIDQSYVYVRTGPGIARPVLTEPGTDSMDQLAVTAAALFVVSDPGSGGAGSVDLERIVATSHAVQTIATASSLALAAGDAPSATSIAAIRDQAALAIFAADGTSKQLAASTDPAWVWRAVSAPQPPHALAGSYVVLESNRALDRDELLLVSPSP